MKTRRKSTRKGPGVDVEGEQEAGSSQHAEESQPPSPSVPMPSTTKSLQLSIPGDISFEDLSSLVPDASLDSPTPDTILHIYKLVLAQAADLAGATAELEDARAQLVRKDVELDQALQDKEGAVNELEKSIEAAHNELKAANQQRDELSASQSTLQSQLSTLNSSQFTRSSELDVLQRRVEDTEREKRDLVVVVDRLKTDSVQAEDEIKTLRDNLKKTRSEFSDLQSEVRDVRSTETTNKFKIQSLEQQCQLAKQESERNSAELDAKIEEFAKYRRETYAQHVSLQSAFDALTHEYEACKTELDSLKRTHQSQQHQLTTALEKVNSLQDQLAEEGAASRAQSDTQARLIDLLERRNAEAKKRVQDVDNEWDRMMQGHAETEERLKEQLRREKERADRLDANLTRVLEGSEGVATLGHASSSPEPSSGATIVASFMKGTKLSDIFDENRRVKEELQRVKMENVRLTDTTTQLISKVQEMAPQLGEQRVEYERQKSETIQLSHQLSIVLAERDGSLHFARDTERKFETSQRENNLLESQLKDLGRQVQALLREVSIHQNPGLANIEQDDDMPADTADGIDALISNQLVVFKHLPSFQEQYTKHLKVIRDLGDKLERVTRDQYEEQSQLENQALEEASAAVSALQEELENQKKSHDIQIRGFMQERDMYKARLSGQSQGRAVYGSGGVNGHVEPPPGDPEYEILLADLQRNFDVYRTETGIDMAKLRDELQEAQRETAQLHAALAKANAKVEFHNERHAMLNDSYGRQQAEISNLRRRNEDLLNQVHRVESASHQMSEQYAIVNSSVERLRHETATLTAEKELWKGVELRLSEENQHLSKEKAQLSDVMNSMNRMHRDLERSVDNDRRRLEGQVQMLESQTQDLRAQLSKERELIRHVTLQKDVDTKELHTRIDRATQELATTRESLVAAETSQNHLQQRADDLSRQLEATLEKLSVYERRPGTLTDGLAQSLDGRSREEQLEAEVAELKGAIKMTEVDLAVARSNVEQFKDISQASEAAFDKVNEAYLDYKKTAEAQLTQRESELQSLQDRLRSTETEFTNATSKITELQQLLESERRAFATDKRTLEETIVDMTSSAANNQTDEADRVSMVKLQEERAMAAEDRYQREIVAHAESIKAVEDLKQQISTIQSLAREKQTAADTAQSILATAEVSWRSQRGALDKEVADINTRYHELRNQNTLLHQHLESISSQAARIRHAADQTSQGGSGEIAEGTDEATSELRSVVAYLRREKEIVDLQLELNKQENMRLKTQVDHLSRSLDETQATLSEERERISESVTSAAQHAELLERINQLNVLRESNSTLRAECETHRKQSEALEGKLRQLMAEVEPVKEEVRTLRAEVESRDHQLERLGQENQKWKDRSQQILSKYDRIDPAEMQQLKDKLQAAEAEKSEWTAAKATLESQVAQLERYKDNLAKFKAQYNELSSQTKVKMSAIQAQLSEMTSERDNLREQLLDKATSSEESSALSARLDALVTEKVQLQISFNEEKARLEERIKNEQMKAAAAATTIASSQRTDISATQAFPGGSDDASARAAVEEAKKAWEEEKSQLTRARDEANERENVAKAQSQKLAEDKAHLEESTKKFQQRLLEQVKRQREQQARTAPDVEQLVRTRVAELTAQQAREHDAAVQSAVLAATEKLRAELQTSTPNGGSDASQSSLAAIMARHEEELKALETRLTEKHAEEVKVAVESALASVPRQEGPSGVAQDLEALVQERLEAASKDQEQKTSEAVKTATENGRKEVNTKFMLKEQQLVRTVAAKKELEEKVKELEARLAGSQFASAKPSPQNSGAAAASPTAKTNAGLPRKPSISVASTPATTSSPATATQAVRGAARGRGRGVAIRGGAAVATAQAAGAGRGGVLASVNSAAAASPSGTSILGAASATAAGKRPRDETEAPAESPSLAKRLRGGPVPIQRNRHLPPPEA